MLGQSTMKVIFLLKCLMKKYRDCKDLHMVFIDLEKTYN